MFNWLLEKFSELDDFSLKAPKSQTYVKSQMKNYALEIERF